VHIAYRKLSAWFLIMLENIPHFTSISDLRRSVKDMMVYFRHIKISDGSMEIHHVCPSCKRFVSADIQIKNGRLHDKITYRIEKQ